MKKIVILTVALAAIGALGAAADKPNFSGDWTLDAAKSNFGQIPPPASMTRKVEQNGASVEVTQTETGGPQGEVTVTAKYSTDGQPTANQFRGADSQSTAKWEGDALAIVTNTKIQGIPITVTERWTLSGDGKIMIVAQQHYLPAGPGRRHLRAEQGSRWRGPV